VCILQCVTMFYISMRDYANAAACLPAGMPNTMAGLMVKPGRVNVTHERGGSIPSGLQTLDGATVIANYFHELIGKQATIGAWVVRPRLDHIEPRCGPRRQLSEVQSGNC